MLENIRAAIASAVLGLGGNDKPGWNGPWAPAPARAGYRRAIARMKAKLDGLKALYADTPNFPPTRQVKRRIALLARKREKAPQ